jgi:TonB-dependent starch-binding outer membrane protein SusC
MKKIKSIRELFYRSLKKILLTMRIGTLFLILGILEAHAADTYSQVTRLSLDFKGVELFKVLDSIESKSDFFFLYNEKLVDINRKIDIKSNDELINGILENIFANTDVRYSIINNKIILAPEYLIKSTEESDNLQQQSIKGTVTDAATGSPMPGVNVIVAGTTIGTITDASGNYTLEVPNTNVTLLFSFVGYVTSSVPLSGRTLLTVALKSEITQLSEVVVVGYGTQLKKDLTGSVARVGSERILDKPAFNISQAIQGKFAGVKILERNGAPGSPSMIRVRGTNSISSANEPLFVVDGIVGVANAMTTLNPNEIESIDVLKDASATAIYGARGANGVIMITTKRGIYGKTQVEFYGYVTRGVISRHVSVMNTDEFLYSYEQGWANMTKYAATVDHSADMRGPYASGTSYSELPNLFEKVPQGTYFLDIIGKDGNYYRPRFNTNWEDVTFPPSFSHNEQIIVRTGSERAKLSLMVGNSYEDGLALSTYFRRRSARINGDINVFKWLDISTNLGTNLSEERLNDDSYISGGINRIVMGSLPLVPTKYPDDVATYGRFAGIYARNMDFPIGEDSTTPKQISDEVEKLNDRTQVNGDITLTFKIAKDLTFKTSFATDLNYLKYNYYASRNVSRGVQGQANINTSNTRYWQNENYLNYFKSFGDHSITGLLGLSWSRYNYENLNASNSLFFDDFYQWHSIGVGTYSRPGVSSADGMYSLNSYYARLNYAYKDKYLLTLTGRYDGSSKFGKNSKYGFFPSGSVAWRLSQEEFIKNIATISNLKIRLSAGQTGNQEIGSYVTQTFLSSANTVFGTAAASVLYPSSFGNADLKWETTTQYDAGLDLGLWHDRVNLTADYYYKVTDDMLLNVPLPTSTTVGTVRLNYGSVENQGVELTLGTHNIKSEVFNWFSNITFAVNRNKILKLGPTGADIFQDNWVGGPGTVLREGEPIGSFWGLNRLGTYSTEEVSLAARYNFVPGDLKWEDKNQDGIITPASDGAIIGYAFPKWEMNINNQINYRSFDFSMDIRIVWGASKLDRSYHDTEDYKLYNNGRNTCLNAWRPDNQNTDVAEVRYALGGAYFQTNPDNHWIQDASFIRGDGATLGYTLTARSSGKIGVQKIRIFLNTKNFFTYAPHYFGYDPEGNSSDMMSPLTPGIDFYLYPRSRTTSFGVNIIF